MRPCENPMREELGQGLYLPIPCGACAPCLRNERTRRHIDRELGGEVGRYLLETK